MKLSERWLFELVSSWGEEFLVVPLPFGGMSYYSLLIDCTSEIQARHGCLWKINMNAVMKNLTSLKDPIDLAGQCQRAGGELLHSKAWTYQRVN